jgi:hypothetical protein
VSVSWFFSESAVLSAVASSACVDADACSSSLEPVVAVLSAAAALMALSSLSATSLSPLVMLEESFAQVLIPLFPAKPVFIFLFRFLQLLILPVEVLNVISNFPHRTFHS